MGLKVYNSLTRKREEFVPLNPPRVTMYVCGPTVYGHSHLGHAKSYVSFDAILRWLRFSGYQVNYVQNITDVGHLTDDADEGEDKIIAEARRRGLHPMAVVETFLASYLEDMDALNLLRPDIMPRASGHIPEQIEATRRLIEKGHAYEVNGSVYFDVSSFAEYGKLSGRRVEQMEAGARVAVNAEKRHPADFALWKRADPEHIMRWPSPWGQGFPGWHIECSAMSQKYLGETFDIHGGGLENQFPHHECEIAQAECDTGKPFARYWLHNNMCTLNGQKMGKSLGNALSLKDIFHTREPLRDRTGGLLLERSFEPVVVRHFILTSHYRQTLDFSNEALRGAESGSYKLRDAVRELSRAAGERARTKAQRHEGTEGGIEGSRDQGTPGATAVSAVSSETQGSSGPQSEPEALARYLPWSVAATAKSDAVRAALADVEQRFADAMNEDFNTAAAIATVFDFARQTGEWIRDAAPLEDLLAADTLMQRLTGDALGMKWPSPLGGDEVSKQDDLIRMVVEMRDDARKNKDFALSDQIRDRLRDAGIELRDGPDGTTWT
ncbi:MAG: cysteine--tRNA ligase [Planctomycetes bacterium]|nr:cysteine--tRNA ligase [Planctomycetota bacterium]